MARQPDIDDIKYFIDVLIQARGEALENADEVDALHVLTSDLQGIIDYFTDYFALDPR